MDLAYKRVPFFSRPETQEVLDRLDRQRRVTIVVGAGASAEVGLPLWSDLVERLLLRGMSQETDPATLDYPAAVIETARRAIRRSGALEAATMARAALGDAFDDELRLCLYDWPHRWQWDRPGATAQAAAKMFKVMTDLGQTCEIATTNYDDKLEQALEEEVGQPVRSLCTDAEDKEGAHVVRHLHGVLTEEGKPQEVTLTEADYHSAEMGLPWQEAYMRRRLEDSTVIFVGASLTDQHLLRYIFRYASAEQPAVALMVEDAEDFGPADEYHAPDESDELLTGLKRGRWDYAHLTALQADFRCQPAQFLYEVAYRKSATETTTSYGRRLDTWFDELSRERLGLSSAADFQVSSLAMVACSDRTWADPLAIDTRLITQPSTRAAVDAFCGGTPQVQLPQGSQKWRWILATPVTLESKTTNARLPVGAVTLVSDQRLQDSSRGQLDDSNHDLLADIERYLADVAADVLDPAKSSD